jgi:hypothetical protein
MIRCCVKRMQRVDMDFLRQSFSLNLIELRILKRDFLKGCRELGVKSLAVESFHFMLSNLVRKSVIFRISLLTELRIS